MKIELEFSDEQWETVKEALAGSYKKIKLSSSSGNIGEFDDSIVICFSDVCKEVIQMRKRMKIFRQFFDDLIQPIL